jgi:hypothetical protein
MTWNVLTDEEWNLIEPYFPFSSMLLYASDWHFLHQQLSELRPLRDVS